MGSEAAVQETSSAARSRGEGAEAGPSRDSVKKLDQIIQVGAVAGQQSSYCIILTTSQNIFAKTGTLILQERMKVSPVVVAGTREKKVSKWVSLTRTGSEPPGD